VSRRARRWVIGVVAVLAVTVVAPSALFLAWLHGVRIPGASGATYMKVEKFSTAVRFGEPDNVTFVLLVGSDLRADVSGARGDAIHVLAVNPQLQSGAILNFPRDTCVDIPGEGTSKINEAHSRGGLSLTAATIDQLVGTSLDFGVSLHFDGFLAIVEAAGGVQIDVPTEMDDSYSGADFQPGPQRLSPHQALAFSRDRHDFPQGDITRTQNQGLLIVSALAQLRDEASSVPAQFRLAAELGRHAELEGLGVRDLFRLGRLAFRVDPATIKNVTIPVGGGASCSGGLSVGAGASDLFADFVDDGVLQNH
jgi:polyisoprenyl-teichoic acid--peptidoglycan teichoic acid transferase